jgi:hypothetical protein
MIACLHRSNKKCREMPKVKPNTEVFMIAFVRSPIKTPLQSQAAHDVEVAIVSTSSSPALTNVDLADTGLTGFVHGHAAPPRTFMR